MDLYAYYVPFMLLFASVDVFVNAYSLNGIHLKKKYEPSFISPPTCHPQLAVIAPWLEEKQRQKTKTLAFQSTYILPFARIADTAISIIIDSILLPSVYLLLYIFVCFFLSYLFFFSIFSSSSFSFSCFGKCYQI